MAPFVFSHEKGRPLPKFGEWDVNNPASADGFTVIFAKARDEKKATGTAASIASPSPPPPSMSQPHESDNDPSKKKWLCCF
ncbi:protein NOI4-like [Primulina huaijiensis]|uniref:protein NOI4-like n=1 Tax=Primulina huaijiensis TaxID=1492673 RepID=UPI003CC78067